MGFIYCLRFLPLRQYRPPIVCYVPAFHLFSYHWVSLSFFWLLLLWTDWTNRMTRNSLVSHLSLSQFPLWSHLYQFVLLDPCIISEHFLQSFQSISLLFSVLSSKNQSTITKDFSKFINVMYIDRFMSTFLSRICLRARIASQVLLTLLNSNLCSPR